MKSPSLPAADLVWEPDGAVASTAYGDVYASRAGAFAQARQVFVGGANLPAAWQGQPDWTILETGFGFGANFLQTLAAWREDPLRPQRLHHVAVEAHPIAPQDWQTWFSRQDGLNVPAAQDPPVQDAMRALLHRIAEESRQGLTVGFHHARGQQLDLPHAQIDAVIDLRIEPRRTTPGGGQRLPGLDLGFELGGIVGHRFLSKYRVGIDVEHSLLRLKALS